MKQTIQEKYKKVEKEYRDTTHAHTNLSRMTTTSLRDRELLDLEGILLELVDALGYLLEQGSFPYGREVARMIYPVPNYKVNCVTLETAGRGIALSLRTGQMSFTLEDPDNHNGTNKNKNKEK